MRNKIVLCVFFFASCSQKDDKQILMARLSHLNSLLQQTNVRRHSVDSIVGLISNSLPQSEQKKVAHGSLNGLILYKWNSDSSMTLITSLKIDSAVVKKEIIIQHSDSILFLQRLIVWKEAANAKFPMVETIDYLTPRRTIRTLTHADFEATVIQDTVRLKLQPFNDVTREVEPHYSYEMDYVKKISNYN